MKWVFYFLGVGIGIFFLFQFFLVGSWLFDELGPPEPRGELSQVEKEQLQMIKDAKIGVMGNTFYHNKIFDIKIVSPYTVNLFYDFYFTGDILELGKLFCLNVRDEKLEEEGDFPAGKIKINLINENGKYKYKTFICAGTGRL